MATDGGRVIPVSIEFLVDAGLANPWMLEWQRGRDEERKAAWAALPRRTRFLRTHVLPRWYEAQHRLTHAADALRGVECDRD